MGGRVWGEDAQALADGGCDVAALSRLERGLSERGREAVGVARLWDAHVHLGRDADGHQLSADDLMADLDLAGCAGAVCFPANEPGPGGDFGPANARVCAAARHRPDRIVPFCRVDPCHPTACDGIEQAAADGARGLKVHPVAQRFALDCPEMVAVAEVAHHHGWPVLVHAGFGVRPVAGPVGRLLDQVPGLRVILAHGGRGDARALAGLCRHHDGVFFDTSLAGLADLVQLPPERVCFGSDRPYGEHATAVALVAEAARLAGWSRAERDGVWGANLAGLVALP